MWTNRSSAHTASPWPPLGLQLWQLLREPWESHGKAIPGQDFRALGTFAVITSSRLSRGCPADANSTFGWNLLRNLEWTGFGIEKNNSCAGPAIFKVHQAQVAEQQDGVRTRQAHNAASQDVPEGSSWARYGVVNSITEFSSVVEFVYYFFLNAWQHEDLPSLTVLCRRKSAFLLLGLNCHLTISCGAASYC